MAEWLPSTGTAAVQERVNPVATRRRRGDDEPQQLVDRDGFCISCICICISLIESTHLSAKPEATPLSTQHKTHPTYDHHAILLRAKPLTHPHTHTRTTHHAPQPQTNPNHTANSPPAAPPFIARERVFWAPERAGNREGDFHSRGRRTMHALIGAQKAYSRGGCGGYSLGG
jgi:hypothetical protein